MSVVPIQSLMPVSPVELGDGGATQAGKESFTQYLQNAMSDVNELLQQADSNQKAMVSGKSENLHEAMISIEKAETALKLMVQVRNKALDAYNEILRMQV